eukprot:TRINITY_DN42251_c0_g1_i1.p1 TRINITY_DN42251_c0_g1~~TRINITY_DN42251_c0_g1_i1.p1  ORF type:complete len:409 (+),score=77.82 TRINITY_DN42251_c0_g1_i1:74-1300(+)
MARVVSNLLAPLRQWRTTNRLAALEKNIRQNPVDLPARVEAAGIYCKQLAVAPAEAAVDPQEAVGRAADHLAGVLEASDDPFFLHNAVNTAVGPALYYRLPDLCAQYMRKIGLHEECLREFDSKSEFEERATQYHLANALILLKATGHSNSAQKLFDEAVNLEYPSGSTKRPIKWTRIDQTPAVYIEGLEAKPFWERDAGRPALATILEESYKEIMQDVAEFTGDSLAGLRKAAGEVPAYPALVKDGAGAWDMLQLYCNKIWQPEACELAPRTSKLLREHLPSAGIPYVHYNTEEAVFLYLAPKTVVHLHNGGSNVPINLSFGLTGSQGNSLEVGGEVRPFQDGVVNAFDDSFDHRVWNDGDKHRWVLVVRTMHPQLVEAPNTYFKRAFTRRTCFEAWSAAEEERWLK